MEDNLRTIIVCAMSAITIGYIAELVVNAFVQLELEKYKEAARLVEKK